MQKEAGSMKVGVLSLQGGVREHITILEKLNIDAVEVKNPSDLKDIKGLILPGGESTANGEILKFNNLFDPIKNIIKQGIPTWGTCSGMVLLAKHIENDSRIHFGLMDIIVKRNAYGSQLESFYVEERILGVGDKPIPLVFIRAPYIIGVGKDVEVLLEVENHIVAVKENNMIATSFHPELTDDVSFHKFFIELCKNVNFLASQCFI